MKKGFTLIEILVTISIISIIATIGFLSLRAYQPELSLSGSAREMASDIRYVQQLAITEQIEYGIKFFVATNEYKLIKHDEDEVIKSITLPSGISFGEITDFIDDEIVFNPYGAASEPGTVELINNDSSNRVIDIRSSGFVKILN